MACSASVWLETWRPDAEDAHKIGAWTLKELRRLDLNPEERYQDAKELEIELFGTRMVNPLGISSGLDKDREVPSQLLALGLV